MGDLLRKADVTSPHLALIAAEPAGRVVSGRLSSRPSPAQVMRRIREVLSENAETADAALRRLAVELPESSKVSFQNALYQSINQFPENRETIRAILRDSGWIDRNLRRTRSAFWRRRAAGALGLVEMDDARAVQALIRLLDDRREEVRTVAAHGLANVGKISCLQAIVRAAAHGRLGESPQLPFILPVVATRRADLLPGVMIPRTQPEIS